MDNYSMSCKLDDLEEAPVIIVGGGVAGLATAIALSCRGIRSVVVEKTKRPGSVDRGDVIHRETLKILRSWGMFQSIANYGCLMFDKFQILSNSGKRLLDIDLSRRGEDICQFMA